MIPSRQAKRRASAVASRPQKVRLKKGDLVVIIAGAERGQTGRLLQLMPSVGRAVVEGRNLKKRHFKSSRAHPQGAIVKSPAALPLSRLAIYEPSRKRPSRIRFRMTGEGRKRTYALTGREIQVNK